MKKVKKALCTVLTAGLILPQVMGSALAADGAWKHNSKGWWYAYSDGTYAKSTWSKINGKWYYFEASGYMATGWIKDGGKWYYLNKSGDMAIGWIKDNNVWYYLNPSGAMATGWKKIDDVWYFFSGSGAMAKGWRKLGGKWYYFAGSGAMVTGWQDIKDVPYYFFESGEMAVGEVTIEGEKYLFNEDGSLNNENIIDDIEDVVVGGWIDPLATIVTEEETAIFNKAIEGFTGASYELMACLGHQVVAGTNYRFLCKETFTTNPPVTYYVIVQVYADLQGNAEIMDIYSSDVEAPKTGLSGAYTEPVSVLLSSNDIVIDEALKALNSALEGFAGASYKPVAVLGKQIVEGANYRLLCYVTPTTLNPESYFAIVTVYKTLDGKCELKDVTPLESN